MSMLDTLGVLAHHGGMVIERPELTVGIVHAVSRPTGLELELLARRPLDRRSAGERQADIRRGSGPVAPAPRRLLPAYDEGVDLRVGWLDRDGRAHWEFGSCQSSSGDHSGGTTGPSLRTVLSLPPLFDHASVVLAWPEIGFAETVIELSLPDRATVERDTVSIWDAPVSVGRAPGPLRHRIGAHRHEEPAVEAGRIVAAPRVLSRADDAVVVLTRLTAVGAVLSAEICSVARGGPAAAAGAIAFREFGRPPAIPDHRPDQPRDHPGELRTAGPGASVADVHDGEAVWARPDGASAGGGRGAFRSTAELILDRPGSGVLDLVVGWPVAGLADVRVELPFSGR